MQQLCPIADQRPQNANGALSQPQQPQPQQSAQQAQPTTKAVNPQQPYQPLNNQGQQQPQPKQAAQQQQQPSRPNNQPTPSTLPPSSAPIPSSFTSPYAPPPPVALNVALPAMDKNERELQNRLQGFLANFNQTDAQHADAYQRQLQQEEERKQRNIQRFQEEEKRKKEQERRQAIEERKQQQQQQQQQPQSSTVSIAPIPAATSAIFPRMLTADQHFMLQQFPSSNLSHTTAAPAAAVAAPAAVSAPAPVGELERNLAATKARKAARQQQQQQQQPQPLQSVNYSPSLGPTPYLPPAASSLPLSLLLAAANSSSNRPMPTISASNAQLLQPSPYAASSPNVGPIRSSPPPPPMQSSPPLPPAAASAAPAPAALHPLIAMLNLSVAAQSSLPPMPVSSTPQPLAQQQQPQQHVPMSSPYAAARSPEPTNPTVLLAPSHFLTAAGPSTTSTTTVAPSSFVPLGSAPPAQPTPLKSKSEFRSHLHAMCDDNATFEWLYQKYINNPQQHPFA